jgi:hypothetical protein
VGKRRLRHPSAPGSNPCPTRVNASGTIFSGTERRTGPRICRCWRAVNQTGPSMAIEVFRFVRRAHWRSATASRSVRVRASSSPRSCSRPSSCCNCRTSSSTPSSSRSWSATRSCNATKASTSRGRGRGERDASLTSAGRRGRHHGRPRDGHAARRRLAGRARHGRRPEDHGAEHAGGQIDWSRAGKRRLLRGDEGYESALTDVPDPGRAPARPAGPGRPDAGSATPSPRS